MKRKTYFGMLDVMSAMLTMSQFTPHRTAYDCYWGMLGRCAETGSSRAVAKLLRDAELYHSKGAELHQGLRRLISDQWRAAGKLR